MHRWCPGLCGILIFSVTTSLAGETRSAEKIRIGVAKFVSHPALDADEKGFEKALAEAGFREGIQVIYQRENAQAEPLLVQAMAQKFPEGKVDLIHAIATPTAQAIVKTIKRIPVVFSSVTDPVDAGLVPGTSPGGTKTRTNVTGVSDRWPVHQQFEMYIRFVPKAKRWGTIYNAADANALVHVKEMRASSKKLGLELFEATVSNRTETGQAARFLAGKVQAVHITSDNTVASSFEVVVKVCNENKIPLFAGGISHVFQGAIAAYGLDYFFIGESAGKKAVRILKGENPGEISWGPAEKFSLVINEKAARLQGAIIPPEIFKKAGQIVK
jgi:putative tryptophan/tyrosine transport system substrate-binding protein